MDCCICTEQFTSSGENIPLLLLCGHSICRACVRFSLSQNQNQSQSHPTSPPIAFKCFVCKQQTPFLLGDEPGYVDGLKINHALVEVCTANHKLDEGTCFAVHNNTLSNVCAQHEKEFSAFCDNCNEPICVDCSAGPCKEHKTLSIEAKTTQSTEQIKLAVARLELCAQQVAQKTNQIQQLLSAELVRHETMLTTVQQTVSLLRSTLDECEQNLVSKIKERHSAAVKCMDLHCDHLASISTCTRFALERCTKGLAKAEDPQNFSDVAHDCASCVTQTDHLVSQATQLCATSLYALHSKLKLDNNLETQALQMASMMHDQLVSQGLVDYEKLCQSLSWCKDKCCGMFGNSAELVWEVADKDGNEAQVPIPHDLEFEVVMVASAEQAGQKLSIPASHGSLRRVVYCGRNTSCKASLEGGGQTTFELGIHCDEGVTIPAYCGTISISIPKPPVWFVQADVGGGLSVSADKLTVSRLVMSNNSSRYCLGNVLPRGGVVRWGVRVTTSPSDRWVFVGIISQVTHQLRSFESESSFGWAGHNFEYVNGCRGQGFLTWQSGDTALLCLDMENNTLTLTHHRTGTTHKIDVTPNTTWRVHVNLSFVRSAVELYGV